MPHPALKYKSKKEAVAPGPVVPQGHKKDRRPLKAPVSFTFACIYPSLEVLFYLVVVDVILLDKLEILLKDLHDFLFHNVTPLSVRRAFAFPSDKQCYTSNAPACPAKWK